MPSSRTRLAFHEGDSAPLSLDRRIDALEAGIIPADTIDALVETGVIANVGIAQLLVQNNAVLRLLCSIYLALEAPGPITDDDVASIIQEITP